MPEPAVPQTLRKTNTVNLALIGMSGAGKSYWSRRMEEKGYRRYNCDKMIAERLGLELSKKGKATLNLANWMGQPFSEGYTEAEKLYLELEEAVIEQICDELEQSVENNFPVVVDTTGSLIYLKKNLLKRLRTFTKMVHLKLPAEKHEELFEAYLNDPKPVIWEGKYKPRKGETHQNALRRCYRELISFRNERYNSIADCVLDYSFHHNPKREVEELLDSLASSLKKKS
ncbi:MAG: Shikimate kinase [Deltaproteobacteria bacterium]|jgi:shikimate kinase|nr:Shikimate kinase [Deltaproteobacteria bacterium]